MQIVRIREKSTTVCERLKTENTVKIYNLNFYKSSVANVKKHETT